MKGRSSVEEQPSDTRPAVGSNPTVPTRKYTAYEPKPTTGRGIIGTKPRYCEWRPYPWIPKTCFEPVTHQLDGVAGDIDTEQYYLITWYVCRKHAMEGVSWGYSIAFNLETDRVEGLYE